VNPFGHIDLRVSNLEVALAFYDRLLPALGFTERYHSEAWKAWATTGTAPSTAYFAVTEEPEHSPNDNRIAFWVESAVERAQADALRPGLLRGVLRRSFGQPPRGLRPAGVGQDGRAAPPASPSQ
jgi:catechol 2,3-dioxygenase-like lactoylglutathione lyase family enzyme